MLRSPDWRFRSAHALRNVSAIPGKSRGETNLQSPIWSDPQSGRGSLHECVQHCDRGKVQRLEDRIREYWSDGVMECWEKCRSLQYSNTPALQYSNPTVFGHDPLHSPYHEFFGG